MGSEMNVEMRNELVIIFLGSNIAIRHLAALADSSIPLTPTLLCLHPRPNATTVSQALPALPIRKQKQPLTGKHGIAEGFCVAGWYGGSKIAEDETFHIAYSPRNPANRPKIRLPHLPAPAAHLPAPASLPKTPHVRQFSSQNSIPPAPYFMHNPALDVAIAGRSYHKQAKGSSKEPGLKSTANCIKGHKTSSQCPISCVFGHKVGGNYHLKGVSDEEACQTEITP